MAVVVQDDVAVPTVELPIRSGVHGHFVGALNSPDLPEQSWTQQGVAPYPPVQPHHSDSPWDKLLIGDSTWTQNEAK